MTLEADDSGKLGNVSTGLRADLLAGVEVLVLPDGRPRVFFDGPRLQRLRDSASGPEWEAVRVQAEALVRNPRPPLIREAEPDGGLLQLAFSFAIWRDRSALAAAFALIEQLVEAPAWVAPTHRHVEIDLRSGTVCSSLALACDILSEALPEPLRRAVVRCLQARDLGALPRCSRPRPTGGRGGA